MRKFISMCAIVFMANLVLSAFASCSSDDDSVTASDYSQLIVGEWEATQLTGLVEFDGKLTEVNVKFDELSNDDWRKDYYYTHLKFMASGIAFEYYADYGDDGSITWQEHSDGDDIKWSINGNKLNIECYYKGEVDVALVSHIKELTKDKLVLYQSTGDIYDGYDDDDPEKPSEHVWTQITYKRVK